jgi:hypothetical protein
MIVADRIEKFVGGGVASPLAISHRYSHQSPFQRIQRSTFRKREFSWIWQLHRGAIFKFYFRGTFQSR